MKEQKMQRKENKFFVRGKIRDLYKIVQLYNDYAFFRGRTAIILFHVIIFSEKKYKIK